MAMVVKYSEILIHTILLALIFSMQLFQSQPVTAAHLTTPEHYISIEFDLQSSSLSANSRVELPAGLPLTLNLSNLNVSRIIVNGQAAEIVLGSV
jgi:hypothetical protein